VCLSVQDSSEEADSSEDGSEQEGSAPQPSVLAESNVDAAAHSPALKSRVGRRSARGAARQSENVDPV